MGLRGVASQSTRCPPPLPNGDHLRRTRARSRPREENVGGAPAADGRGAQDIGLGEVASIRCASGGVCSGICVCDERVAHARPRQRPGCALAPPRTKDFAAKRTEGIPNCRTPPHQLLPKSASPPNFDSEASYFVDVA